MTELNECHSCLEEAKEKSSRGRKDDSVLRKRVCEHNTQPHKHTNTLNANQGTHHANTYFVVDEIRHSRVELRLERGDKVADIDLHLVPNALCARNVRGGGIGIARLFFLRVREAKAQNKRRTISSDRVGVLRDSSDALSPLVAAWLMPPKHPERKLDLCEPNFKC